MKLSNSVEKFNVCTEKFNNFKFIIFSAYGFQDVEKNYSYNFDPKDTEKWNDYKHKEIESNIKFGFNLSSLKKNQNTDTKDTEKNKLELLPDPVYKTLKFDTEKRKNSNNQNENSEFNHKRSISNNNSPNKQVTKLNLSSIRKTGEDIMRSNQYNQMGTKQTTASNMHNITQGEWYSPRRGILYKTG
eukprot:CAMPEP_0116964022 /NCGR_PEP_ID=MMETSP0467-20121206/48292_1 /TAXON_ID=283647 /ORGANISM="Mesodinium pulex, Strain SPMC105" /LENGTH=186 /DNA_ID=CAMNT_0004652829 /DNA_START=207 /DNA_END=767 /DNA_ORIENTATION=+